MHPTLPVRPLTERAQGGDREAFDELVRLHFAPIYSMLHRHVGNHEDAEDLAQECFVRAWRALSWRPAPGPRPPARRRAPARTSEDVAMNLPALLILSALPLQAAISAVHGEDPSVLRVYRGRHPAGSRSTCPTAASRAFAPS